MIQLSKEEQPLIDPISEALDTVQTQLKALQNQQEAICEYLEKGIYTIDMFTKRNTALTKEIKSLLEAEADLIQKKKQEQKRTRQLWILFLQPNIFWTITIS